MVLFSKRYEIEDVAQRLGYLWYKYHHPDFLDFHENWLHITSDLFLDIFDEEEFYLEELDSSYGASDYKYRAIHEFADIVEELAAKDKKIKIKCLLTEADIKDNNIDLKKVLRKAA